jgi:alanine racemase
VTDVTPRVPIEARLAKAGLPPLPRTAWLEIDLDAIRHNLSLVRTMAGPQVAVRPVVKADAYGHGGVAVARALEDAGIDGLCVAAVDEALELRDRGIRSPLVVLYPTPPEFLREAAEEGIAVTAGDASLLGALVDEAARVFPDGGPLADRAVDVHLEYESGLGRGGFDDSGIVDAAARIEATVGLRLAGLWTHYQAVEDGPLTASQTGRLDVATGLLRAHGFAPPRHVAASSALLTGDVQATDGVRPGLAIYGLLPDELQGDVISERAAAGLRPAMAFYARPVRVMDLPTGWGVSYGPTFRTSRPSRIATLPLGYGDGWARALSNRASALVRGLRVPLVGNVAMDAVMADVTDVPGEPVGDHDEFVLIGRDGDEEITVGTLAHERNTNRWEVVTAMARRVPRVYHAAAGPVGLRTLTARRD